MKFSQKRCVHTILLPTSNLPAPTFCCTNCRTCRWTSAPSPGKQVDQDSCDEPQSLKKELVDSGRNLSISINQGLNICLLCSLMNATQNLQETLCGQDRLGHGIETCLDTVVPPLSLSLSPSCCCHAQNCCDDALSTTQMYAYVVHLVLFILRTISDLHFSQESVPAVFLNYSMIKGILSSFPLEHH